MGGRADLYLGVVRNPEADDEPVAAGAAVQAAALGTMGIDRQGGRGLGTGLGITVEPDDTVDRFAVRAAYADGGRSTCLTYRNPSAAHTLASGWTAALVLGGDEDFGRIGYAVGGDAASERSADEGSA